MNQNMTEMLNGDPQASFPLSDNTDEKGRRKRKKRKIRASGMGDGTREGGTWTYGKAIYTSNFQSAPLFNLAVFRPHLAR